MVYAVGMTRDGQCYLWVPTSLDYAQLVHQRWRLLEEQTRICVQIEDSRQSPTYFSDYSVNFFYPSGEKYKFVGWLRAMRLQNYVLQRRSERRQISFINREEGLDFPHKRIDVDLRFAPTCADWYIAGIEPDSRLKVNQSDETEWNSSISVLAGTQWSVYTSCNDWLSAQGYTPYDYTYCKSFFGYQQPTELDQIGGLATEIATAISVGSFRLRESSQGDPEVGKPFDSLPNRPRSAPG
jgi:hypothetical protein